MCRTTERRGAQHHVRQTTGIEALSWEVPRHLREVTVWSKAGRTLHGSRLADLRAIGQTTPRSQTDKLVYCDHTPHCSLPSHLHLLCCYLLSSLLLPIRPSSNMLLSPLTTSFYSTLPTRTSLRSFSTTPHSRASILFALNALSNSRETQHFNKISRLSRVEHSPTLKLIQTGEINPYPLPTPPPLTSAPPRPSTGRAESRVCWDTRALRIGRALLADQARSTSRLQRQLRRAQHRSARQEANAQYVWLAWREETRKHRAEMRSAGGLILATVGVATGLATWRFWPDKAGVADSGELGRRIAERAQRSFAPLPRMSTMEPVATASPLTFGATQHAVVAPTAVAAEQPSFVVGLPTSQVQTGVSSSSWWKGLFWKQQ